MAGALEMAVENMKKLCRKYDPPFVASISRRGDVHLRWPK